MSNLLHIIFFIFVYSLSGLAQTSFEVPRLSAPVNDAANLIDKNSERRINGILHDLRRQTGTQIVVLTVNSLQGVPIEQASIQIVDQWQLGGKETDKGVLFFISKNDRKMRIEVGQGLEGDLPDAYAKRILDDVGYYFKQGQMNDGILAGVLKIIRKTNPSYLKANKKIKNLQRSKAGVNWVKLIFYILFFLIFGLIPRRRFGGSRYYGGGWSGSSSGGFGGGFSGGGGGFSGGGASGSW